MRNIKNLIVALVVFTLSINLPFITTKAEGIQNKQPVKTSSGAKILKTATSVGNGKYEIDLKMLGDASKSVDPADIVLVMDISGSMQYNIRDLVNSMNGFVENTINNLKGARISVVSFGGHAKKDIDFSEREKCNSNQEYIDKIEKSYAYDGNFDNYYISGTNIASGLQLADEVLKNDTRINAPKYVVLFTDGVPDYVDGKAVNFGSSKAIRSAVNDTLDYYNNDFMKNNPNIKTFTIGLLDNIGKKSYREYADSLLNDMQNSGYYKIDSQSNSTYHEDDEEDEDDYDYDDNNSSLSEIYKNISNKIIMDNMIAKNLVVKDVVNPNFEIVKNAYGNGQTSKVLNLKTQQEKDDIKADIKGDELTWNIGDLDSSGLEIKFRIKPKNDYWGSDEPIFTNEEATVEYTNPITGANENGTFNKPTVDIPYKEGKINIKKNIVGLKEKSNDNFTICLDGGEKGKYYIKVVGNGQTNTLSAYLKDKDTDISNNKDTSKNYLLAGDYTVKEIDSLGYDINSISINGEDISLDKPVFTIDKNNKEINISISNKKNKVFGFFDLDEIENKLGNFIGNK